MTIDELLAGSRTAAAEHGRATREGNARKANKAYRKLNRFATQLKKRGADAHAGWLALLDEKDDAVRVWAASHALEFAPEQAVRTLRSVASGRPGPDRLDAEMTLREWEAGRLP